MEVDVGRRVRASLGWNMVTVRGPAKTPGSVSVSNSWEGTSGLSALEARTK